MPEKSKPGSIEKCLILQFLFGITARVWPWKIFFLALFATEHSCAL